MDKRQNYMSITSEGNITKRRVECALINRYVEKNIACTCDALSKYGMPFKPKLNKYIYKYAYEINK